MHIEPNGQTWVGMGEIFGFEAYGERDIRSKWAVDQKIGRYKRTNLDRFRNSSFVNRHTGEDVGLGDAIRRAERGEAFLGYEVPVVSDKHHIYGEMDVFEADNVALVVTEEKRSRKKEAAVYQAVGYALALKERYAPGLPIVCRVRDAVTGQISFEEVFVPKHEEGVVARIQELHSLLKIVAGVNGGSAEI